MYVDRFGKKVPSKYDEDPVYYCRYCLSLDIRTMDGYDYCNNCGSMAVQSGDLEKWDRLYQIKYGKKLINK